MVAKSDIVILLLSASVLGFGLTRLDFDSAPYSNRVAAPSNTLQQREPDSYTVRTTTNNTSAGSTTINTPPLPATPETVIMQASGQSETPVIAADLPASASTNTLEQIESETVQSEVFVPNAFHRVRRGESLSLLARRYNTTVEELQRLNNLTGTVIQIDQQLLYPVDQ